MNNFDEDDILTQITDQNRKERRKVHQSSLAKKQAKRERAAERKRQRGKVYALVAGTVAILFIVFVAVGAALDIFGLRDERNEAQQKLAELEKQKGSLEEELTQVESEEYVKQRARDELKMIEDGEVLYIVKDDENTKK